MKSIVFWCYRVNVFKMMLRFIVVAGLGFVFLGNSGDKDSSFRPGWVGGDCTSFWDGKMKDRICGVGSFSESTNITELRKRAVEAAKEMIEKELEARVQAVVEHYGKSHHGHKDFGNPPNLDKMKETSRNITKDAMQLSEINDFWITSENEVYTLVSLTATGFDDAIGRINYISEELRKEMHKRAEKTIAQAEKELRKELEKEARELMEKESGN